MKHFNLILNMKIVVIRLVYRSQPRRRRYSGQVILDSQPLNWIKHHRSFASKEWFYSQVRYGQWIRERNKRDHYLIYVTVIEKIKPIKVLIKIRHTRTHVLAYHAHVLR